jgi:LysM repeat protein
MKTSNLTWSAAFAATLLIAGVAAAKTNNNNNQKNGGNGRLKVLNNTGNQQRSEPFNSSYVVVQGDTLPIISLKEYGTTANARFIAQFNHISQSQALQLNQVLNLPSIGNRGQLTRSRTPVAGAGQQNYAGGNQGGYSGAGGSTCNGGGSQGFPGAGGSTFPTSGFPGFPSMAGSGFPGQFPLTTNPALATAASTFATPTTPAPLSRVVVGSTLLVDAVQFGPRAGSAQLRVGGAPMKVEVLEWTASAVKVHLPQLQLAAASPADLVIVRGDGTIASKTSIQLVAAPSVALAK